MPADRLDAVLTALDRLNAEDPRTTEVEGEPRPKELVYAERMSARLDDFAPEAGEALRIAARAQHVCRWTVPREDFPEGRKGYLRWRQHLYGVHADIAGRVMREHGYEDEVIARVQTLLRKKGLRTDDEVQTLEDVICLVFLEHEYVAFAAKHEDDKVVDIVRKTWGKMSARGHDAAVALLPALPERERRLVEAAVAAA